MMNLKETSLAGALCDLLIERKFKNDQYFEGVEFQMFTETISFDAYNPEYLLIIEYGYDGISMGVVFSVYNGETTELGSFLVPIDKQHGRYDLYWDHGVVTKDMVMSEYFDMVKSGELLDTSFNEYYEKQCEAGTLALIYCGEEK